MKLEPFVVISLAVILGIFFSLAVGLCLWWMETRRKHLEEKLRERTVELAKKEVEMQALYEASRVLFGIIQLEELYHKGLGELLKILQADEGSLMLLDPKKGELFIAACRGMNEEIARTVHIKLGERVAGKVAQEKKELLLINGLENYPDFKGLDSNKRIRSSIVLPLVAQEELLGVVSLNRTQKQENFTENNLRSAMILAAQLALAIRNARYYQSMEKKIRDFRNAYHMLEEAQKRLVESEKLASIGQLVAGVGHELNNPLTTMMGYTELSLERNMEPILRERLSMIFKETKRCVRIVQDLLTFARKSKPNPEQVDPCALIDESLEILSEPLQKDSVSVIREYPSPHPLISADAHQLRQVFLNILTNACHALEQNSEAKKIVISVIAGTDTVEFTITDNGPGITTENLAKIFDPFFTTKKGGKGTGLGLSICYGIIKEHGGSIRVQSSPGEGAVFMIRLPIKENQSAPVQEVPSVKTILVADDEEFVRNLVVDILTTQGYTVDWVADGEDAFNKVKERSYDLIVSDYIMPRMNGKIFYEQLRSFKPEQAARFLFVTGSITGEDMTRYFKENGVAYLLKPFSETALLDAVKEKLKHTHESPIRKAA